MLHTYWTSVRKFLSAEQKSSMQVLESSSYQDHADGNVESPVLMPSKRPSVMAMQCV
jgi:hypothetical protein